MRLLTLNVGGASAKLAAYRIAGDDAPVALASAALQRESAGDDAAFAQHVIQAARTLPGAADGGWDAIAHRIVHGGPRCRGPALLDAVVRAAIVRATPLAPLHNPAALAVADAATAAFPGVPQLAVFDTAFFASLPDVAARYALPAAVTQAHDLFRCGFHGLAHAALWERAERVLAAEGRSSRRVITLQLGSGASVAAIDDGRAVDVSMGYSTLEGLVMGTRSGDVDPGVLLHLLAQPGFTGERLASLLARDSGLLGLSGRSAHVHELLAAEAADEGSRQALAHYAYRARRYIGACLATLGGADAIVFGGGVGEGSPVIRERLLAGFGWAGIRTDAARNAAAVAGDHRIDAGDGVLVLTAAVDEGLQLARAAATVPALRGAR